jgi:hypothetical protein
MNFLDQISEFYQWSKFYIKYIGNTFLSFEEGNAAIVDLSRCEENMNNILLEFGYHERFKIKKRGKMCKYKNKPVVVLIFTMEKPVESNSEHTRKEVNLQYLEVIGYCYESESAEMKKELNLIKTKLSE